MENVDIKTIVYVIIAIIWFLYSTFNKSKKQSRESSTQPPPLSENEIKEIFQKKIEKPILKKNVKKEEALYSNLANEKRIIKTPATHMSSFNEDEIGTQEEDSLPGFFEGVDVKNLIIYSEILKRPEY
jgi:uncharacterized protein YneF (UPF0154 family)